MLIQLAESLESAMRLPTWFDGLVLSTLVIGFPVALIFTWAFKLTPHGLQRIEQPDGRGDHAPRIGGWLDALLVVTLLALVATLFAQQMQPATSEQAGERDPSSAVESFADGGQV
jgi:hypothetical protein